MQRISKNKNLCLWNQFLQAILDLRNNVDIAAG